MMRFAVLILSFLIFSQAPGCSPGTDSLMKSGTDLLKKGKKPEALLKFEKGIIKFSSEDDFSKKVFHFGDGIIYSMNDTTLTAIYPKDFDIKADSGCDYLLSYDPASERVAFSGGTDIKIIDSTGSLIHSFSPDGSDKDKIKSILLRGDSLFYFINNNIYIYNIARAEIAAKYEFFPPYKSEDYRVKIFYDSNSLGVVAGIAGNYYFSIIDIMTKSISLKNLEISSSKLFFSGNSVYYISGLSGRWTLNKITLPAKNKTVLTNFTSLRDIEFSRSGIVYEDKDNLWVLDYENHPLKTPFRFELTGGCGEKILIRYEDSYYVADTALFLQKINCLNKEVPELFEN